MAEADLRARAMALIAAGNAAADPGRAVARAMGDVLADPSGPGGRWQVIALGKAARAMAEAALAALPGAAALVITNAGNDAPLAGAEILVAGHPVPNAGGEAAATRVEAHLAAMRPEDRVLALISGGGSAMLPAPVSGVSLAEKQATSRLLLGSGADITQMNLIRQALSRLKGGGWCARSVAPITALILSDVPGDDLRVVASGPTVSPIGTLAEAAELAVRLGIWEALPVSVRAALTRPEPAGRGAGAARNRLVGSNGQSLAAMVAAGGTLAGLALEGDVEAAAAALVARCRQASPGEALVFGGETTVRLTGDGLGGRNQELALRFARRAVDLPGDWVFAAVGSDGRDGPGEAAGGMVGPKTLARLAAAGHSIEDVLARNDSTPALTAADALVTTGPTGTNVADLAVFLAR